MSDREPAYAEILQLDRLLPLAGTRVDAPAGETGAMRFFLAVHQAHEIWFVLIVEDLDRARDAVVAGDPRRAAEALERGTAAAAAIAEQMHALESLQPDDFQDIRVALGSASGLQSARYREIEFVCGLRDPRYLRIPGFDAAERSRLRARLGEPSLAATVREHLVPRVRSARPDGGAELDRVVAALRGFDREMRRWRDQHVRIARRFIGDQPGTAGSEGTGYLEKRRDQYLFGDVLDLLGPVPSATTS